MEKNLTSSQILVIEIACFGLYVSERFSSVFKLGLYVLKTVFEIALLHVSVFRIMIKLRFFSLDFTFWCLWQEELLATFQ